MKRILLFAGILCMASSIFATTKTETRTYYGTQATQSTVNPCTGPTVRVCAEIKVITEDYGFAVRIDKDVYDYMGEFLFSTSEVKYGDFETVHAEDQREALMYGAEIIED